MRLSNKLFGNFCALLLIGCIACNSKNTSENGDLQEGNKDKVEEQNKDKFSNREEKKDAQFVVDAIDNSYALLELAELGSKHGVSERIKEQAKSIINAQTSIANDLKNYAQDNDISVQLAGPENTKNGVENLHNEDKESFDEKWCEQIMNHNKQMIAEFERYENNADGSLQTLVTSSLSALRARQDEMEEFIKQKD